MTNIPAPFFWDPPPHPPMHANLHAYEMGAG